MAAGLEGMAAGGAGGFPPVRELALSIGVFDGVHRGHEALIAELVREAVQAGRVAEAARLLGRPFRLSGEVASGDRRGRTIGFPTANLPLDPALIWPRLGVYAVRAHVAGEAHAAVANLGVRPTFDL